MDRLTIQEFDSQRDSRSGSHGRKRSGYLLLVAASFVLGALALVIFVGSSDAAQSKKIFVSTLQEVPSGCQVVGEFPGVVYQEAPSRSVSNDPMTIAAARAVESAQSLAKSQGASGMIGLQVAAHNRTQVDEGGVLLIGTFVKCDE